MHVTEEQRLAGARARWRPEPGVAALDVGAADFMLVPDELGLLTAYVDERPVRCAHWRPQPGDVVLDIGAAVGSYTVPALMAGARVIAVDPDAEAIAKLKRVIVLNRLTGCTVVNAAVFDTPGYPEDVLSALEVSGYGHLIPPPDATWVMLDTLADGLPRLDWIKIDVEGAELGVLRSGKTTLARFHPRLLIEDHAEVYPFVAAMDSRRQCRELLSDLGYSVAEIRWGPPPRTYLVCNPENARLLT